MKIGTKELIFRLTAAAISLGVDRRDFRHRCCALKGAPRRRAECCCLQITKPAARTRPSTAVSKWISSCLPARRLAVMSVIWR